MSLINDLIRRARAEPPPAELTINDNQVGTLAEYARSCMMKCPPRDELEAMIRAGKMRFMAIPLRVLGAHGQSGKGEG
jgi:hypothetical protein